MTEQQAVSAADSTAQSYGYSLANYESPWVTFKGTHWRIIYQDKSKLPGQFFMVLVDDRTGQGDLRIGG